MLAHPTSVSPWPHLVIAAVNLQTPKHCGDGVTGGVPVPAF